jgi:hypothetical protein
MRFLTFLMFVVTGITVTGIIVAGSSVRADGRDKLEIVTATGSYPFIVEIAASQEARARGLMFRREMAANAGMLFDYGYDQPVAMWMKNTYIPLDMLFVAGNGRVVNTHERAVPHSLQALPSSRPVRAVLEVVAGTVSRLGIRAGDIVRHRIFSTAPAPE